MLDVATHVHRDDRAEAEFDELTRCRHVSPAERCVASFEASLEYRSLLALVGPRRELVDGGAWDGGSRHARIVLR